VIDTLVLIPFPGGGLSLIGTSYREGLPRYCLRCHVTSATACNCVAAVPTLTDTTAKDLENCYDALEVQLFQEKSPLGVNMFRSTKGFCGIGPDGSNR
jgi:hypothetical protein